MMRDVIRRFCHYRSKYRRALKKLIHADSASGNLRTSKFSKIIREWNHNDCKTRLPQSVLWLRYEPNNRETSVLIPGMVNLSMAFGPVLTNGYCRLHSRDKAVGA
jgi:hypothetical protein